MLTVLSTLRWKPLRSPPLSIRFSTRPGEGPCLDAAKEFGPAVAFSADLAAEEKWPRFGPAAAEHGMRSVVSTALLPYAQPSQLSGALNIYSRRRGGLDQADHNIAFLLATYSSLALAATQAVALAELQVAQLHKALDTRDVIGQAKGILMNRRGVNADEAFDILRRTSQELNVRLTEIAQALVDRRTELDTPESDG